MSKAFDNLIKKVKDKSPSLVGDVNTSAKIIWADVPSPQVTYMMGGGIPTGRIIRFRGPSSAGKSAFCNYIASCLQKECPKLYNNPDKNKVVYLDFERTFEIRFASSVGIDTSEDKFYHLKPQSIEEAADILDGLVKTGEIAAIIFDSDAAAPTAASMVDEFGKACVAPNTMVEFEVAGKNVKDTMAKLFKAAGYENYKSLKENEFVKPKNKIGIYSWENGKKVLKEVEYLVYKGGTKNGGYRVTVPSGQVFLATGMHKLYNAKAETFESLDDIFTKKEDFYGLTDEGKVEKVLIEKVDENFPILDMQVEGTHTYFSAGLLSHNTFGGQARAISEFLRKFNILCSDTGTTVLWISQERANMKPMARLPQACVTPDTTLRVFENDSTTTMTMEQLFNKAGFENWQELEVNNFYNVSDKKLYTMSYNDETHKPEKKLIESLVYKGEAPVYEVVDTDGTVYLKCSGKHRLYDADNGSYIEAENIKDSFNVLLETGDVLPVFVRKTDTILPIVDLQVKDNHNYYTNSILSHNTGGEALPFYCSIICRVTKKDDIKGTGDEGIIGIEMCVRNYKNKCSTPFRMAEGLKLYYNGGFDPDSEYIDFLLKFGYMELKGSYFKFNYEGQDYSIQGRNKLLEWLHGHQDIYDVWQKEIKAKLSGYCEELDASNIAVNEETGVVLNEKDAEADAEYLLKTTGHSSKSLAAEALSDDDNSE